MPASSAIHSKFIEKKFELKFKISALFLQFSGDVDSGDDNDAPEPSTNHSQQRCAAMRMQSPSTIVSATNFHHGHRSGNASKATSPITVNNVYASKELNKSTPSASSPLNILLHHGVHIGSESSSSNNNSSRGDARVNGLFNGSLDLLNGVENANVLTGSGTAALNRQMRLRAYGNGVKNGMVRHETKL